MPTHQQQLNEETPVPLKFVGAIASVTIAAATGWMMMSARVDQAQADIRQNREDISTVKSERSDALKIWQQDRIENAGFKSEVMTKLDRIERKLDRN